MKYQEPDLETQRAVVDGLDKLGKLILENPNPHWLICLNATATRLAALQGMPYDYYLSIMDGMKKSSKKLFDSIKKEEE